MRRSLYWSMHFLFAFVTVGCHVASAQTDIGLSGYGAFNSTPNTTFDIVNEYVGPANAAGGMIEFRHLHSPWVGFEATYSLNRANQIYMYTGTIPVGASPGPNIYSFSAYAHELTGDWIVSNHLTKSVLLFALAGTGVQITAPTNSPSGSQTSTSTTPSYIYGFGTDWQMLRHIGLRAQYRGDIHKAPRVDTQLNSPNSFIHTAEPMVGGYYRF